MNSCVWNHVTREFRWKKCTKTRVLSYDRWENLMCNTEQLQDRVFIIKTSYSTLEKSQSHLLGKKQKTTTLNLLNNICSDVSRHRLDYSAAVLQTASCPITLPLTSFLFSSFVFILISSFLPPYPAVRPAVTVCLLLRTQKHTHQLNAEISHALFSLSP